MTVGELIEILLDWKQDMDLETDTSFGVTDIHIYDVFNEEE